MSHRCMKSLSLLVVFTSLAVAGSMAYAQSSNDARPPAAHAKITLTQAIASAEQYTKGQAVRAEYERTHGNWAYDVEVISGSKVLDVRVDGEKGTILSSKEDRSDHDDHDAKD